MSQFSIIKNKNDWKHTLQGFNHQDCYYSYEYGNLFAKIENGELCAAFFEDGESEVFYPFIKRRVPFINECIYDIVTPYGYGGPLVEGNYHTVQSFYENFNTYCQLNNIITETIRFHPLYENEKLCKDLLDIAYIRKTVAVDLTPSIEEIRNNYSTMNKRNIRKAKNSGLTCYIAEKNRESINSFIDLYNETMDRNHASGYYYFDEEFFVNQVKDTDISETFLLFAKKDNEIIAGVMILIGKEFSHYHLGASRTKYLGLKPNNLLFDFMIEFCKNKGSSVLHLGGGYSEDDGLFKFKSSFTKNNHYKYFLGKRVHKPELYDMIVNQLKEENDVDTTYFPIYRGPLKKISH